MWLTDWFAWHYNSHGMVLKYFSKIHNEAVERSLEDIEMFWHFPRLEKNHCWLFLTRKNHLVSRAEWMHTCSIPHVTCTKLEFPKITENNYSFRKVSWWHLWIPSNILGRSRSQPSLQISSWWSQGLQKSLEPPRRGSRPEEKSRQGWPDGRWKVVIWDGN